MDTSPEPTTAEAPGAADRPRPYPVVLHLVGARCLVVGAGPGGPRPAARPAAC